MTSREKVMRVINRESCENVMWSGHPGDETVKIYAKAMGVAESKESIYTYLKDDCRWIMADSGYKNPAEKNPFELVLKEKYAMGDEFTIDKLQSLSWPSIEWFDFSEVYQEIEKHQDRMVFTGMWSGFFHILAFFFGMENYFIKMYEDPELVDAVTKKVADFYVDANDLFFRNLGDRADVLFFGNDLGTQRDLLISPDCFREFVLPTIKKIVAVGKKYDKKVMFHSCGSIYRIIPDLIDAGIDILHPIQAKAEGMSAVELAQYKDRLTFVGGIDAQTFFVNATAQEIEDEVSRVKRILSPGIVISPSHEEILPNVPVKNIIAMADKAHSLVEF